MTKAEKSKKRSSKSPRKHKILDDHQSLPVDKAFCISHLIFLTTSTVLILNVQTEKWMMEWRSTRFVSFKWTRLQKKRIVTIKIITSHSQSWNIDSQLLAIKCPLGSPKLIRKLDENIWHIRHDVYTTIVIGKINFVSHSTRFPIWFFQFTLEIIRVLSSS